MILLILLLCLHITNTYSTNNGIQIKPKPISIECNSQGYPKIDALKILVTQYLHCSNQKNIIIKEISGGYYTEKMYIVMTKKDGKKFPLFFFKISKKYGSTKKLLKIQEGPIAQKFIEANSSSATCSSRIKKQLPIIIWLNDIVTYKNQMGETKTIEISPSAKGQVVQDILNSENLHMIKKAAEALGKSLAAFHQLYIDLDTIENNASWKSVFHGDFSIRNTLFDIETNKIYFIDNETMQEGSIIEDIKTILISMLMFRYLQKNNGSRWPIYLEYCQTFLKAYIESYPIILQAKLAKFIEKKLDIGLNKALYEKIIKDSSIDPNKFNKKEFKQMVHHCLHKFDKTL
ncbi:hypothetical protein HYV10_03035 [Candidatus Dependentiae bacterium]|nr:hypothetical protein [Candidatus Dependentiae bacterium]